MTRLINRKPSAANRVFLSLLPFALLLLLYLISSDARLADNPADKLLPSFSQMGDAMYHMMFEANKRSGDYLLWTDTLSSLIRLGSGVLIAALAGLIIGLLSGALPLGNAALSPIMTVISLIPPLALLPILFIVFGLGEVAKIVLIAIGIAPFIARDMQRRTEEIPREQIIKAQTLGAGTNQIIFRILLPQLMPRLIESVRLSLGSGWLFLIAAEATASTDGLGYRIFLVRRYLSMDIIIPYVIWITLLAFLIDFILARISRRLYPWDQP